MSRSYALDLRERAVAAFEGGRSCRSVGVRFDIAPSTVVKWSGQQKTTGFLAPGKVGGHRRPLLEPHRDFLLGFVKETPHLTLFKLQDALAERGVKVSHDAIWWSLRQAGYSFKKSLYAL